MILRSTKGSFKINKSFKQTKEIKTVNGVISRKFVKDNQIKYLIFLLFYFYKSRLSLLLVGHIFLLILDSMY